MTSHLPNCEHALALMINNTKKNKAEGITHRDWLDIVQKTGPCLDCLNWFEHAASPALQNIFSDDLNKRSTYIIEQRRNY